jgi:hypothetical protein
MWTKKTRNTYIWTCETKRDRQTDKNVLSDSSHDQWDCSFRHVETQKRTWQCVQHESLGSSTGQVMCLDWPTKDWQHTRSVGGETTILILSELRRNKRISIRLAPGWGPNSVSYESSNSRDHVRHPCRDSGRKHGFFFWVGWEEQSPRPMEFKLCSISCCTFKQPKFLYYISSLCSGVFTGYRHVLVRCVRGTVLMHRGRECVWLGSTTRRVSFYTSLGGGDGDGDGSCEIELQDL